MSGRVWPAYGAALVAAGSAVTSAYWAAGGTLGLDTLGGQIEEMARSGRPEARLLALAAVVLKLVGVAFALALVQRWGAAVPRRLLVVSGWAAAGVLVLYGGLNVLGAALVVSGIVPAGPETDLYALRWHMLLWDPIFVVWGLLLGYAVRIFARDGRPGAATVEP